MGEETHASLCGSLPVGHPDCIRIVSTERDEFDVRFSEIFLLETVDGTLAVFLRTTQSQTRQQIASLSAHLGKNEPQDGEEVRPDFLAPVLLGGQYMTYVIISAKHVGGAH